MLRSSVITVWRRLARAVRRTLLAAWQPQVLDIFYCAVAPTVICFNGAQKVAPNEPVCYHNTGGNISVNAWVCVRACVWESVCVRFFPRRRHVVAPSCLSCFHCDTVLYDELAVWTIAIWKVERKGAESSPPAKCCLVFSYTLYTLGNSFNKIMKCNAKLQNSYTYRCLSFGLTKTYTSTQWEKKDWRRLWSCNPYNKK